MALKPKRPEGVEFRDIATLVETFADSIQSWSFDGHTLRLELTVTRVEEPEGVPRRVRYPVCRLVLTATAAGELLKTLQHLTERLAARGPLPGSSERATFTH